MDEVRVLISAAGEAKRWGNYGGNPKHGIEIEGEVLIGRLNRQLAERGVADVQIAAPVEGYCGQSNCYVPPNRFPTGLGVDKLAHSVDRWAQGRTIVLFGDVWFSEEAIDAILTAEQDWFAIYRPGASQVTGWPHPELFGFSFHAEHHEPLKAAIARVVSEQPTFRPRDRHNSGGWPIYRAMLGLDYLGAKADDQLRHALIVDDWTEDFDVPKGLHRWLKRRRGARPR